MSAYAAIAPTMVWIVTCSCLSTARRMATTSTTSSAHWANAEIDRPFAAVVGDDRDDRPRRRRSAASTMTTRDRQLQARRAERDDDEDEVQERRRATSPSPVAMPETMKVRMMIASSRPNVGRVRPGELHGACSTWRGEPRPETGGRLGSRDRWAGSANDRGVPNPRRSRTACAPKTSCSGSTRCGPTDVPVERCALPTSRRLDGGSTSLDTRRSARSGPTSVPTPGIDARSGRRSSVASRRSKPTLNNSSSTQRLPPVPRPRPMRARSTRRSTFRTSTSLDVDIDVTVIDVTVSDAVDVDIADIEQARPWTPTFDEYDDLDGLLVGPVAAAGTRVSWRRPPRAG